MKGSHVAHKSRERLWIPRKEVDEAAFGQSLSTLFTHDASHRHGSTRRETAYNTWPISAILWLIIACF